MGITVEAAATLAAVVSSAVVTTVAAGVGSTVAASVAGAGAGSAGGGAGASASGAGSGGAIMLLGQVQSMALTSQFNVDMPEAYSSFTGGFGWANLQLEILGRWEPAVPSHNATANATTSTGRRPEDERARSEECGTSEGGGNAATAARNATKEIGRDGTSAYLGSLHTSAERFFLNNLVREQGSKCSESSKW